MRLLKILKLFGFVIIWFSSYHFSLAQDYSFGDTPCEAPLVAVTESNCASFSGIWKVRSTSAFETFTNFDDKNNNCSGEEEEDYDGWLKFRPGNSAITLRMLELGSRGITKQNYALYIYRNAGSNICPQNSEDLELLICSTSKRDFIHESLPVTPGETYYARIKVISPKASNELSVQICIQSPLLYSKCPKEENANCNATGPYSSLNEIAQSDGTLGEISCPNTLESNCTDFCDLRGISTGVTGPTILEYCFEIKTNEYGTLSSMANMNGSALCLTLETWLKNINLGIGMVVFEPGYYDQPIHRDSLVVYNGFKLHEWYGLKPNQTYKLCHYISIPQPLCTITRYCPRYYLPEPTYDCPELGKNFGDICDDQLDATENDIVSTDCNCEGTPISCPSSDFSYGAVEMICSGATPRLPIEGEDFTINDPSGTRLDSEVSWYLGSDPDGDDSFILEPKEHSGFDICGADPEVELFGFVSCDQNRDGIRDSWVQVATWSYKVYPDILPPTVQRQDESCSYTLSTACSSDVASPSSLQDQLPGSTNSSISITINSGIADHPCGSRTFEVMVEACPATVSCPTSDFTPISTQYLCNGDTPNIPIEDTDFRISDPSGTRLGSEVVWFEGSDPDSDSAFDLGAKNHSGFDMCSTGPIVELFGFIECDQDQDGVGDSWIEVSTFSYQVFPDIEAPKVVREDNSCSYSIVAACTNDVIDPGNLPDQLPGSSASTVIISVNSGIANHPCGSEIFELEVEGCPAEISCPTSDHVSGPTQYLCNGATPNLPVEDTDFRISDPSGTRLGSEVVWFEGSDPDSDSAFDLGAKNHSGFDMCSADPIVELFGFIECDQDQDGVGDSWIEVATFGYQVFPDVKAPTVVREDNSCSYSVVAACTSDVIDPGSLLDQLPGSSASTVIISVNSSIANHPCGSEIFELEVEGCPAEISCPTSDHVSGPTQYLCTGATPSLPIEGEEFNISDLSNSRLDNSIYWFLGSNPDSDPVFTLEPKEHSGIDICSSDPEVELFGFVACDQDRDGIRDSWVQVASHRYQIFPDIKAPAVNRLNNLCSYNIATDCSSYVVNPSSLPDQIPGSSSRLISITITSGIPNHPCGSETFEVSIEACPEEESCPSSDFVSGQTQYLCSGQTPSLPEEGIDFTISDRSRTRLGSEVMWFEGNDPSSDPAFDLGPAVYVGNDICSAGPEVEVFGFIECDQDQDGIGDSWVQVADHRYQLFPDIEAPTVSRLDGICSYTITTGCSSEMANPARLPDQSPGSGSRFISITVISGISNHPCGSETFEVEIEGCPRSTSPEVFFPNAFTPNDDHLNDRFRPILDSNHYPEVAQFLIFNRWGEMIFMQENLSSENSKLGWNGKHNEKSIYTGSYVYKVVLVDQSGRHNTFSGKVLVLK